MSGVQQAVFQNQRSFGAAPDAQFNYVTMLLHGDGTNGAQNNTFLDSSTNNFTITRNGNTTQGSFSPYGSNWSNYLNNESANNSYLSVASNAAFAYGTADFTVECWVFMTATPTTIANGIIEQRPAGTDGNYLLIGVNTSNQLFVYVNTADRIGPSAGTVISKNSWNHIAYSRSSGTATLYLNGTSIGSWSDSTNYGNQPVGIGFQAAAATYGLNYFAGYISNVRIVKGTALYTTTFTPPTTPLTAITNTSLLTCQSNRFIDNSTNNFAITVNGTPSVQRFNPFGASTAYDTSVIGGSGYFDGGGDYLGCGSQSAYAFGTGDFTLNAWFYLTAAPTYMSIADTRNSGWALAIDASRAIYLYSDAVGFVVTSAVGAVPLNAWTYVTVKRVSGTMTLYLNAVSINSASNSTNFSNTTLTIGANGAGGEPFFGYICDFQAIKGTGTTPTLPTAPLANVTNTSLLLNYTNGAIFDNAMMNNLETVGNAQISTSVKKYGTGSLYFDGTGDNLTTASAPSVWLGSGAFTLEMWLYPNDASSQQMLLAGSNTGSIFLGMNIDGSNRIALGRTGVAVDNFVSYTYTTSAWIHLAITRDSSNNVRFFVDGTQVGSTGTNSNSFTNSALNIGFEPTQKYLNGYIDDLRVTKGYARYTANFIAPTAALPDTGPY